MSIITLTSDMGIKDFYLASIKGSIYKALPDAKIVDISHHITPFDIAQAAFIVKNTYPDFPENTIHIISVDPEPSQDSNHVVIYKDGQYFIANDNGVFSLIFDDVPDQIWKLTPPDRIGSSTFPSKSTFVWAATLIAQGTKLEDIAERTDKIKMRVAFRPTVESDLIKGTVIFIDGYGNVITNIDKKLFEKVQKGRNYTIYFRGENYGISKISATYNEVPPGEKLAIFGAGNFLEIAINKGVEGSGGGANKLFGIKLNDIIRIEFS